MSYTKRSKILISTLGASILLAGVSVHANDSHQSEKPQAQKSEQHSSRTSDHSHNAVATKTSNHRQARTTFGSANLAYHMNAKQIIGMDVVNGSGEELGTIDDLVMTNNDEVVYAIVSVGGFLGIGDKLVAVRFDSLHFNQTEEQLLLNVTQQQLEQAPEFKFQNS